MARKDKDRDSPSERRDYYDQRSSDPIKAATPSPAQVQRESEREVLSNRGSTNTQVSQATQVTGSSGVDRWAGHNQSADGVPLSIASYNDEKSASVYDRPNEPVPDDKPKEPEAKPDPAPEPEKPVTGRSKARGSRLTLSKSSLQQKGTTKGTATRNRTDLAPKEASPPPRPRGPGGCLAAGGEAHQERLHQRFSATRCGGKKTDGSTKFGPSKGRGTESL